MALLHKESFVAFPRVMMSCPLTGFHQHGATSYVGLLLYTAGSVSSQSSLHSKNMIFSNTHSPHKNYSHFLISHYFKARFSILCSPPPLCHCIWSHHSSPISHNFLSMHNLYSSQDTVHSSSFRVPLQFFKSQLTGKRILFTTYLALYVKYWHYT